MPKYRFDQIAINSTAKKKPEESDKYSYIGLEHLDSGTLTVSRWGSEVAPIGEKLLMKKGDILFGKRRAYQKKVAIAPFDGIFSAHGMVLRPNEAVIDKDFFPMFISSDYFLDAAIKISVGSLSPTINWKDLAKLEFEIPELDEQRKVAPVLWAITDTIEKYKALMKETDSLVLSQFIDMFSNEENYDKIKLNKAFDLQMGKTPPRADKKLWESNDYKWISIADMSTYGKYTRDTKEYLSAIAVEKTGIKPVPKNTVIMSFKLTIGRTAITSEDIFTNEAIMAFLPKTEYFDIDYLRFALQFHDWTDGMQNAVKGVTLNKAIIGETEFVIPPLEMQKKFAMFAEQCEKSKEELQCSLEAAYAIKRKLIEDNFIVSGEEES